MELHDENLIAEIEALIKRGIDMSPAMKNIGEMVSNSVRQNFIDGGRPEPWTPLSFATLWGVMHGNRAFTKGGSARGRLRIGAARALGDKQILIGKGTRGGLMGSIGYNASTDNVEVGAGGAGPSMKYARIHQFGGMAGRGNKVKIPARPYLVMQPEDEKKAVDILSAFVFENK
jgi:phage gpG-like protein